MTRIKTKLTDFSIPMSENPIVFGYKHGDNEVENFEVLSGDFAQFQKNHADDASGIRVVKREDWKSVGYEIQKVDGVEVVTQIFDRTKKTILDQKLARKEVKEAPPSTVEALLSEIKTMRSKIERLEQKDRSVDIADSVDEENRKKIDEEADALSEFAKEPLEEDDLSECDDSQEENQSSEEINMTVQERILKLISDNGITKQPSVADIRKAGIDGSLKDIKEAWSNRNK